MPAGYQLRYHCSKLMNVCI